MDYVVGSVAALISGNVTPNRPRLIRKALTPTKHQPSPNVTPKSEAVDDRSIFLSPTLQKKKAIVKKSPKRIFQNPDLDTTNNENDATISPKAEKVKKHLKDDLEADSMPKKSPVSNKSPKNKRDHSVECDLSEAKSTNTSLNFQSENESTPKKKKKKRESHPTSQEGKVIEPQSSDLNAAIPESSPLENATKSPKKMKQRRKSILDISQDMETEDQPHTKPTESTNTENKTKSKKNKKGTQLDAPAKTEDINETQNTEDQSTPKKKKNKKRKKKSKPQTPEVTQDHETDKENQEKDNAGQKKKNNKKKSKQNIEMEIKAQEIEQNQVNKKSKKKSLVNPNAITNKDSDSEHESDDEIESENEEINKKVLNTAPAESSSDEEEETQKKPEESTKQIETDKENDIEVVKRTLFVGNVPFSSKCKKEIKKIFSKYGQIETIRIRTVPVKDARTTPKLAVIKKELHPERSTVNVYIKYTDPDSVEKALSENNTMLNEHHLRVSRSDHTGAEHDPKCSIFVGNLPFALEDEALRAKFDKCGEIDSVRIIRDKKTNAGKGFGYVNFKSKDGVELALELSEEDLTIKNRILRVKRCTQTGQKNKNQPHQKREFKKFGQNQGNKFSRQGNKFSGQGNKEDGAHRRIANKRKNQDGSGDGPENKRQKNLVQPSKEKKARKEFVGMTAEKKKKHKFNKGQKKKKALSEILTK